MTYVSNAKTNAPDGNYSTNTICRSWFPNESINAVDAWHQDIVGVELLQIK
ncbi:MAG: hypothetical protein HYX66_06120 [Ignavibacteria bacterium]|nr:hypothetical protein [Ignavibacteria bacterium]